MTVQTKPSESAENQHKHVTAPNKISEEESSPNSHTMKLRSRKKTNPTINVSYEIVESEAKEIDFSYDDILNLVNQQDAQLDFELNHALSESLEYANKYNKKQLVKIAEYYSLPKRKKSKDELIEDILIYEHNMMNFEKVYRRKKFWSYLEELKEDDYLSKYIFF